MNLKCQVFTPPEMVNVMLDSIGYKNNVYDKKIIDNACGDGQILCIVVRRYIEDARRKGVDDNTLRKSLTRNVFGIEIDIKHNLNCRHNLNNVLEEYNLESIDWIILNADALKLCFLFDFHFVVGNPPYIKYSDLTSSDRVYVREYFDTCKKGKFDYCYAFVEQGIKMLSKYGRMSYLIPNSIFKNVFAEDLREYMLPYTYQIIDYKTIRIFENAMTSSSIINLGKEKTTEVIEYTNSVNGESIAVNKNGLARKWIFSMLQDSKDTKFRFGDYYKASISIATQLNEAFLISEFSESEECYKTEIGNVEKSIVRRAISPRNMRYGRKEIIIFPYYYDKKVLKRYTEDEIYKYFPMAVEYLNNYKEKLLKRKSDKSSKWFEYGRSQALAHLNQKKILLSTVVTNEINVYHIDKESIPYSGIYITALRKNKLDIAVKILKSDDFLSYVKSIGISANGTSVRITPADINNYLFEMEGFDGKG